MKNEYDLAGLNDMKEYWGYYELVELLKTEYLFSSERRIS